MKRWIKITLGVIAVILLLMIIGSLGKDDNKNSSDNKSAVNPPSGIGSENLNNNASLVSVPESGASASSSNTQSNKELLDIKNGLGELQGKINEMNSEDLGGLA